MAFKKINYKKSLEYFLKDINTYQPKDCHTNAYISFFDCNYQEIEKGLSQFSYVTGFLLTKTVFGNVFYTHSWIEKNGDIIDVSLFANMFSKSKRDLSLFSKETIEQDIIENVRYCGIHMITNDEFNRECQKLGFSCNYDMTKYRELVEGFLQRIVSKIENNLALRKQHEKNGFKYINRDAF